MSKKLLIVTATSSEADIVKKIDGINTADDLIFFGDNEISLLVTGVGSVATAWSLKHWLSVNKKPDLIINAGIAGSYKDDIRTGDVVMPVTECFADSGIEDRENFLTLFESDLADPDEFPYRSGLLHSDLMISEKCRDIIRPVNSISVNTATGSEKSIIKLQKKFNPDIETMEGATFFYICTREKLPFLALRSISNKVEARNRSKWNIPLALEHLSEKLKEVIIRLE
ncbi:MAG: futalosine hydrolase [Bacteroidales bacterium]|nr:futalosine hydrolase [Bacteroidales bacterium]MBK7626420.1 futalosine hydrolase [Bacteroidales bacterium]